MGYHGPISPDERAAQIAALNDALRTNIGNPQGSNCVVMSRGVAELIEDSDKQPFWIDMGALKRIVSSYSAFDEDNNPWGERDFGSFRFKGTKCFFKIDYYASDMVHGSDDPANPDVTARVLTIATMAEY